MATVLLKLIPFMIILSLYSVSSRRRDRVVIKGTTIDPHLKRKTAKPSAFCPVEFPFTFSDRSKCCKSIQKSDSTACPVTNQLDPYLRHYDSDDCCDNELSRRCAGYPHMVCKSRDFKEVANSFCPSSHPLSFAKGSRCCKYQYRENTCSSGQGGTKLEMIDNLDCCTNWIPCTSSDGLPSICQDVKKNCNQPAINSSSQAYHSSFKVENVLNDHICEDSAPDRYFLFQNHVLDGYFIVDVGCELMLTSIFLRNTNNGNRNDRGTIKFEIDLSSDNINWDMVIASELQDSRGKYCQIPLEEFPVSSPRTARYIRFRMKSYIGGSGGLQHISWGIDVLEKYLRSSYQDCPKPVIDSHDGSHLHSAVFEARNVFTNVRCETTDQGSFWLAHSWSNEMGFVIDLKCKRILKSISLKNTHNGSRNDRATRKLRIEISDDKVKWTVAIRSELKAPFGLGCDTPLETYNVNHLRETRYIKFVAETYHGNGAGLQYITWDLV